MYPLLFSSMPFTPFHFGHSLPIILMDMNRKRIDAVSALLGSVIVDIEPIIILFFLNSGLPLHGPFHSFPMAVLLGIITGVVIHLTEPLWQRILGFLKWKQNTSLKKKIIWGIIMTEVHVFLDAMIYPEMNPWLFFEGNPFLGLLSSPTIYLICSIGIVIGIVEYFIYRIRYRKVAASR
ncbi:MAG: hypothetical protein ACTSWY_08995 [Promethearchaeota archaeon]